MYQVTKLLENEKKKNLKHEWKTKLWDGNTVKKRIIQADGLEACAW